MLLSTTLRASTLFTFSLMLQKLFSPSPLSRITAKLSSKILTKPFYHLPLHSTLLAFANVSFEVKNISTVFLLYNFNISLFCYFFYNYNYQYDKESYGYKSLLMSHNTYSLPLWYRHFFRLLPFYCPFEYFYSNKPYLRGLNFVLIPILSFVRNYLKYFLFLHFYLPFFFLSMPSD